MRHVLNTICEQLFKLEVDSVGFHDALNGDQVVSLTLFDSEVRFEEYRITCTEMEELLKLHPNFDLLPDRNLGQPGVVDNIALHHRVTNDNDLGGEDDIDIPVRVVNLC